MNANIGFGRRIRPPKVTEVQHNKTHILFNALSAVKKTANITVGADPIVLVAFGIKNGESITVNNVFGKLEAPFFLDGEQIVLTPTNNMVILALSGIYNCETEATLGDIVLISYASSTMQDDDKETVALTNPNGPHSNLPNTYYSGASGLEYSQEFFVGTTPIVFRAYGVTNQVIYLETLFRNEKTRVMERGMPVALSAQYSTLIIHIAGRYRFRLEGDSTGAIVAVNPTTLSYNEPYPRRGETGAQGPQGIQGIQGERGDDGQIRYTGVGPPPSIVIGAHPNDTYMDLVSGDVYKLI